MDIPNMLSNGVIDDAGPADTRRQSHAYPTRHAGTASEIPSAAKLSAGNTMQRAQRGRDGAVAPSGFGRGSPTKKDQKHVVFQLIDPDNPRLQARLPMRVMISPTDTTDSIITTVKNFYGLYEYGVSFENKDGVGIIAAFDNFENDMTVYVRTVAQPSVPAMERARDSASPKKPTLGAPFEMRHLPNSVMQSPSRSHGRSAGIRSLSPQSDTGRRSVSAVPGGKPRPFRTKSKENSVMGDADGNASDDNDQHSVTSSRRSKAEEIKAEITVDNIVEGGRRKRAFESSELPLFVPPQVPISASISSISPQRRNGPSTMASPYAYSHSNQHTFAYAQPLPSPQSYGSGPNPLHTGFSTMPQQGGIQQSRRQLRGGRTSAASHSSNRLSGEVLPTPEPTVGSVISDEDVALQLMRLGDPMALSHGRTSTSTLDDALSGKAEVASSEEDSDDSDEEVEVGDDDGNDDSTLSSVPRPANMDDHVGPLRKKQRVMNDLPSDGTSADDYEDTRDGTFDVDGQGLSADVERKGMKFKPKVRHSGLHGTFAKAGKPLSVPSKPKKATTGHPKTPMSPASLPQSRKASISSTINFQHQLGADEEDLSSKPRCQRCRKSKKGCDRQRPCGRCRDAGIGIDGCISEDEGNGRKGRYGRHMGVPIKKAEEVFSPDAVPQAQQPLPPNPYFIAPALPDKSKKRKR